MTYQAASDWGGEAVETGVRRIEKPAAERAPSPTTAWRRMLAWFHREAPPREVGPYRLLSKVGEGGMGVVYEAAHRSASRPLALKLMRVELTAPDAVERFEHEARVTKLFHHPNLVSALDSGRTDDGAPYYVMEYLDGEDLQTLVRRDGPLAPARVARIMAQLASALGEVHRLGLLHGDLKPANVILCAGDQVKLLDFGLAREFEHADPVPPAGTREIAGTPLYLSPELLLGKGCVDGRSDLYALGALAYFLLTGAPPFTGKTALEVCFQHLDATPVPACLRSATPIPPELDTLISSCLAKAPEQRPANAGVVERAALSVAANEPHSIFADSSASARSLSDCAVTCARVRRAR